jgi:hypothetical protein
VIFIIIVVAICFVYQKNNSTSIDNFSNKVENISADERLNIKNSLEYAVSYNVPEAKDSINYGSVFIRDGSYEQYSDGDLLLTSFIVDIPNLKQSYRIFDTYADQTMLGDYTQLALCLPISDLVYGDFQCKDRLSEESSLPKSDPILGYFLFYHSDKFQIFPNDLIDDRLAINVEFFDSNLTETERVDIFNDWMSGVKLDVDDYIVNYL